LTTQISSRLKQIEQKLESHQEALLALRERDARSWEEMYSVVDRKASEGGGGTMDYISDLDGGSVVRAARSVHANLLLALDGSGEYPDSVIKESSVTQHQAALTITESQISDLDHYTDDDVDAHLSGGDGISYSGGTVAVDLVDAWSGLEFSGGDLRVDLDAAFTWTGAHTFQSDIQADCDLDFVGAQSITTTGGNLTLAPTEDVVVSNASVFLSDGEFVGVSGGVGWTFDNTGTELEANATLRVDGDLDFVGAQSITTTGGALTIAPALDLVLDPGGNDVVLSDADLELSTTYKVQFRDSALTINSSADGQLDINADAEVEITAVTIDLVGNVDVSNGLDVTGNVTVSGTVDGVDVAGFNALQFVVLAASGYVANERVLQLTGDGIDITDAGAGGNLTVAVDVADIIGSGLTESSNNIDLAWGTPTIGTIEPDDAASAGTSTNPARSDHQHAIACAAPSTNLSVSSSNAEGSGSNFARSTHTHAITSSSNPGAAAALLASDASGYLQLKGLGIGTAATAQELRVDGDMVFVGAQMVSTTAGNLTLQPVGDLILDPTGADVTLSGANLTIPTTFCLYLRDTALKVYSSADGQLDVDADTEVEITAPTIQLAASTRVYISGGPLDLNGTLEFQGAESITTTADHLTIAPADDLILDPAGNDVLCLWS